MTEQDDKRYLKPMKPKKKQKSPNRSKKDYGHQRQKETKEP